MGLSTPLVELTMLKYVLKSIGLVNFHANGLCGSCIMHFLRDEVVPALCAVCYLLKSKIVVDCY